MVNKSNLKKQLVAAKEDLCRLENCFDYMESNFEAKKTECDQVLEIIRKVMDRKKVEIEGLKEKIGG